MNAQVLAFKLRCNLCGARSLEPMVRHQRCADCGAWNGPPKRQEGSK